MTRRQKLSEFVTESYRAFCRENGLKFHFWDELPKDEFDPERASKEFKLHHEAMNCFNNLKPRFVLFDNKIHSFHFTDWGGGFDDKCWDTQDFLNEAYSEISKNKILEKQINIIIRVLVIIIDIFLLSILVMFGVRSPIFLLLIIIWAGVAISLETFIRKKFIHDPIKNIGLERDVYIKCLSNLKQQFTPTKR